ncbi:E3 ubiquitin-protein ligase TRIM50 [Yarrowia sp. C11]|nr:E3 ubiquitin-protein ligase TRIM50 [Yarrowia sp. C11]KAG5370691.1 E3 ubiquitin-protein ligase TRIM50 [Yarrowia sp. E02]
MEPLARTLPPGDENITLDYWSLEYLDLPEQLACPVCTCGFVTPYSTKCGHTFCRLCILSTMRVADSGNRCPICRAQIDPELLRPAPLVLVDLVNELQVKCPFTNRGCGHVGPRSQMEMHCRQQCDYAQVPCRGQTEAGSTCGDLVHRRYVAEEHLLELQQRLPGVTCVHTKVTCLQGCDVEMPFIAYVDHCKQECTESHLSCLFCQETITAQLHDEHMGECSERPINCPAAKFGCRWEGARRLSHIHTASCVYAQLTPVLEAQEEKMDFLRQENQALRYRLDRLDLQQSADSGFELLPSVTRDDLQGVRTECDKMRGDILAINQLLADYEVNTSMQTMRENMRTRDDIHAIVNVVSGLRHQMHLLMTERRRHFVGHSVPPLGTPPVPMEGSSSDWNATPPELQRRSSDPTRQDVKL